MVLQGRNETALPNANIDNCQKVQCSGPQKIDETGEVDFLPAVFATLKPSSPDSSAYFPPRHISELRSTVKVAAGTDIEVKEVDSTACDSKDERKHVTHASVPKNVISLLQSCLPPTMAKLTPVRWLMCQTTWPVP